MINVCDDAQPKIYNAYLFTKQNHTRVEIINGKIMNDIMIELHRLFTDWVDWDK